MSESKTLKYAKHVETIKDTEDHPGQTLAERGLYLIYQEHKSDRHQSNFFRLDNPRRDDE